MRDLAVLRAREDLECPLLVCERCCDASDRHGLRKRAIIGDGDERRAAMRNGDQPPIGVVREVGAAAGGRGYLREAAGGVGKSPADEGLPSPDDPVPARLGLPGRDIRLPLRVGREVAAALLRLLDDIDLHGVLGCLLALREEFHLLAPGRGPEHAVPVPRGGRLQLRGAPREAERARLLGRRVVDELNRHRKFGREPCNAEAAAFDVARLRERCAAREKRTVREADALGRSGDERHDGRNGDGNGNSRLHAAYSTILYLPSASGANRARPDCHSKLPQQVFLVIAAQPFRFAACRPSSRRISAAASLGAQGRCA